MNKALELRERRAKLWNDAKTYLDEHRLAEGYLRDEDAAVYEKMVADVVKLGREIRRLDEQVWMDREVNAPEKKATSRELSEWMDRYFIPRMCPFCGKTEPKLRIIGGGDRFRDRYCVVCDYDEGGCGAEGGWRHSPSEALACWNERRRKYRE